MVCTSAWSEKKLLVRRSISLHEGDIKGRVHPEAVSSRFFTPTSFTRTGPNIFLRSTDDEAVSIAPGY
jgi:hypothetical protein